MRRTWRRVAVAVLTAVVLVTPASCGLLGQKSTVYRSRLPAVQTRLDPPQYLAPLRGDTVVLRRGEHERTVRRLDHSLWLTDGRLLMATRQRPPRCPGGVTGECDRTLSRVLDVATGERTVGPRALTEALTFPGQGLYRVNSMSTDRRIDSYAPDLGDPRVIRVPGYDGPHRDQEGQRFTNARAQTVGGSTYLGYSDGTEDETEEYGYLRYRHGRWTKVLRGQRMVALFVSHDGRALLGLQQRRGEPCGGCVVDQRIVELDPVTGRIAASYGVPPGYRKAWRVLAMDKVGDRVAVRYEERCVSGEEGCHPLQRGTWAFDGGWTMEPKSNRTIRWWQGRNSQVQARSLRGRRDASEGFQLWWVHDYHQTRLRADLSGANALETVDIPGSLLRPAP